MPFLRVIRDKRGYETTYLMHVYRDGARQQTKVLYAFRTPALARVGREPLEQEILAQIEAAHPDLEFDWKAVFQGRQVIEPGADVRRSRRREAAEGTTEPSSQPTQPGSGAIPVRIEGGTADERIAFLSKWYPIARERVDKVTDPLRREKLVSVVERINPAAWTDVDEITAGLQEADTALERLSRLLSRRRRRSRKSSMPEGALPADGLEVAPAGKDDEGPSGDDTEPPAGDESERTGQDV